MYKKGQKGKKEVSEQKRKDKEKKNNSEIDKSREEEEEEEEEERMEEEPEVEEEDVESWASETHHFLWTGHEAFKWCCASQRRHQV